MFRLILIAPALVLPILTASAQPRNIKTHAGDIYEIRTDRHTSSEGVTSIDRDVIIERVIAVRDSGLELEYDLPQGGSTQNRALNWQFPARVFKPVRGPVLLLNRPELETRIDNWLKTANLPRDACGKWYFTWNAFRVECNPEAVVHAIEGVDLTSDDLRDGALYRDPQAREPAPLTRKTVASDGETFVVALVVDPDVVRRERAEEDVAVGEMVRKPVPIDTAIRQRSTERISGTITITFEADLTGQVHRRTKITNLEISEPDGRSENRAATEIVERRLLPPSSSDLLSPTAPAISR